MSRNATSNPLRLPEGMHRPGMGRGLIDVLSHHYLLKLLVHKELRVRYQASFLGLAWSYVKPAVQFCVFYFVMGNFLNMKASLNPFAIYLFSGIIAINLFSEILGNATRSVVGNAALVNKIYLPRELFPVSSLLVALVHFLPQVLILIIGAITVGWRPAPIDLAAFVVGTLILLCFGLGLGLAFGAINVAYRDIENIVDLILMVAVWFSPVLYSVDLVRSTFGASSPLMVLYELNPLTIAVQLFQRAFWWPTTSPDLQGTAMIDHLMWRGVGTLAASLLILAIGDVIFHRMSRTFAQEL